MEETYATPSRLFGYDDITHKARTSPSRLALNQTNSMAKPTATHTRTRRVKKRDGLLLREIAKLRDTSRAKATRRLLYVTAARTTHRNGCGASLAAATLVNARKTCKTWALLAARIERAIPTTKCDKKKHATQGDADQRLPPERAPAGKARPTHTAKRSPVSEPEITQRTSSVLPFRFASRLCACSSFPSPPWGWALCRPSPAVAPLPAAAVGPPPP